MSLPDYQIGRVVLGDPVSVTKAYARFREQPIDETCLAPNRASPFTDFRRGLSVDVPVTGVGTFKGSVSQTLTFSPSARPGWWIRRLDLPEQLDIAVDIVNLRSSAQNLVLGCGSAANQLRMVEHIIALKAGLGVDDVLIKVTSSDPPLFDASSRPLVDAMEKAGITTSTTPVRYVTVKEPLAFGGSRGDFLLFLPAAAGERNLRVDCAITWNTVIGSERVLFDATPETFKYASLARTNATRRQYVLAKTIGRLFSSTRNLGYTKENILIHGPKGFYGEPRFPMGDKFLEPVWHRATLDLMAALSLTGPDRLVGTVVSYRAGHTLDCDAIRALYRNDLLCSI